MTRRNLCRALLAILVAVPLLGTAACQRGEWDRDRGVMVWRSQDGGGGGRQ
jgi:hypothetical protein